MRVLDLYSGTGSSTVAFEEGGATVKRVELDRRHRADLYADVLTLTAYDLLLLCGGRPDFVWASPPCTGFSVASIGTHWGGGNRGYEPKTDTARRGVALVRWTLSIIRALEPRCWLMENPRGMLRTLPVVAGLNRWTVTYCAYGDARMKPTDLWGVMPGTWRPRPMCRNGAPCHTAAPRGAQTGTQGIRGSVDRSRVPLDLSREVFAAVRGAM